MPEGGEIKPFEYHEETIPVELSGGEASVLKVLIDSNYITASHADLEPYGPGSVTAPVMLNLDHQPKLDTKDTVTFAETEPWDQYTEKFSLTLHRAAWEAQGSPETLWTSMFTLTTIPEDDA